MDNVRSFLSAVSWCQKRLLQVINAVLLVWLALWLAFIVLLRIDDMHNPLKVHFWLFAFATVVAIPFFVRFGMYRAVTRYFSNDAIISTIGALSLSSLILMIIVYWYSNHQVVALRSIIFSCCWLSLVIIVRPRLFIYLYFVDDWLAAVQYMPFSGRDDELTKVAVYGADVAGISRLQLSEWVE